MWEWNQQQRQLKADVLRRQSDGGGGVLTTAG